MAEAKKTTKSKTEKLKAKKPKAVAAHEAAKPEPSQAAAAERASPVAPKEVAKAGKGAGAPAAQPAENLSLSGGDMEPVKICKSKGSNNVCSGSAHVLSTCNHWIVTITALTGQGLGWA